MIHHRTRTVFAIAAVVLLIGGCTSGGTAPPADDDPRVVQVSMTDDLRFEPDEFTVQAGETVRFEVTNAGEAVHEFLIGDQAAQEAFEMEMAGGSGMEHETEAGGSVQPGETEAFEYTFIEPGELLVGCHEPGHYDGGMVASISVEG